MWNVSTQTALLSTIIATADNSPRKPPIKAPVVVVPRHRIDISSTGKLQLAATEKARPTMKATFWFSNT